MAKYLSENQMRSIEAERMREELAALGQRTKTDADDRIDL